MNHGIEIFDVNVREINQGSKKNFGELTYHNCHFCKKSFLASPEDGILIKKLGGNKTFCTFCLRHNFNYRSNCNILILSYRGIIGYYYFELYKNNKNNRNKIWLNQIKDMIDQHMVFGLKNPTFFYDPDTYLWFLDFNKIGKSQKKIEIERVLETNKKIIQCFKLSHMVDATFAETDMLNKFEKAIKIFYQQRKRPKDKRILCPTLSGIINRSSCGFEKTRKFNPEKMTLL